MRSSIFAPFFTFWFLKMFTWLFASRTIFCTFPGALGLVLTLIVLVGQACFVQLTFNRWPFGTLLTYILVIISRGFEFQNRKAWPETDGGFESRYLTWIEPPVGPTPPTCTAYQWRGETRKFVSS